MGPGGHIEANEPETVALTREILEETGLTVTWDTQSIGYDRQRFVRPNDIVLINIDRNNDQILDYTFYVEVDESVRNTPIVSEVPTEDIGWFDIKDALKLNMFPDTRAQVEDIAALMHIRNSCTDISGLNW